MRPPEREKSARTHIHYIRYIHFYFHLMDGICWNLTLRVLYERASRFSKKRAMAESTLKSLLFELVTFLFNNLDCVVHDNDESTEVMMTKTMMVIILNL